MHPAEAPLATTPTVKRRKVDGTQEDVACPFLFPDYQKYMRGVDCGDQLKRIISRRSEKNGEVLFLMLDFE